MPRTCSGRNPPSTTSAIGAMFVGSHPLTPGASKPPSPPPHAAARMPIPPPHRKTPSVLETKPMAVSFAAGKAHSRNSIGTGRAPSTPSDPLVACGDTEPSEGFRRRIRSLPLSTRPLSPRPVLAETRTAWNRSAGFGTREAPSSLRDGCKEGNPLGELFASSPRGPLSFPLCYVLRIEALPIKYRGRAQMFPCLVAEPRGGR